MDVSMHDSLVKRLPFICKIFVIAIIMLIGSMFFFPYILRCFPVCNTKMILACVGLILYSFQNALSRNATIKKSMFTISLLAISVSLVGFISVVYNASNDYTYSLYVLSMWVWVGAAYCVVSIIKLFHKDTSILLLIKYLTFICVFQCILAMTMQFSMPMKNIIDKICIQLLEVGDNTHAVNRLYGLGAALDVAGSRFSAILVMIIYVLWSDNIKLDHKEMILFMISLFIIIIIGNMISRTTIIGLLIGIIYMIYSTISSHSKKICFVNALLIIALALICCLVYLLYKINPNFRENLRFGFEGIFSLVENGTWDVTSNETLKSMIVWPDNLKTWIIGDGYFNGAYLDPYYVGNEMTPFYKGTDIGYCRFIFYFGIIGLISFIVFFIGSTVFCINKFPKHSILFLMILTINMIVWTKVATDIFLVFAFFLMSDHIENKNTNSINNPQHRYENNILHESSR